MRNKKMVKKNSTKINKMMVYGLLLTKFGFPIVLIEVILLLRIPFIGVTVTLSGFVMFMIGKKRANKK